MSADIYLFPRGRVNVADLAPADIMAHALADIAAIPEPTAADAATLAEWLAIARGVARAALALAGKK